MIELRKNIANIILVATLITGGIGVAGSVILDHVFELHGDKIVSLEIH
jgi:hypothetical protein